MLNLLAEYLTENQREHLRHSGYIVARVDSELADRVAFHSGVPFADVVKVLDTLRTVS